MKKDGHFLAVSILVVLVLIMAEICYYVYTDNKEEPVYNISIIVYGNDTGRWDNMKQGAEQAADGTDAEVSLVMMSSESDAKEQIALIRREIENGADALLIAACDSTVIEDYIRHSGIDIPVIFVQNGLDDNSGQWYVSADNYRMGHAIADTIAANERRWIKAAVIADEMDRKSVEDRFNGVYDPLSKYVDDVVVWKRNENENDSQTIQFLQRELTEEAVDVVVSLDTDTTEALMDAVDNLNKDIKIYAIANSDKAVYYLDSGKIKTLLYENDFSIGYIGVGAIMNRDRYEHDKIAGMIDYEIVNEDNMYSEKFEKLLFPFVK